MLIVMEIKEFTEFGSAVYLYECVYGIKYGFSSVFLRASFSKCSMKMLEITRETGEGIAAPEVCS